MRALLLIHRYLGVAVGLLMALWCLSGVVMIHHHFPQLTATQRLRGLEPLRLQGCCAGRLDLGAANLARGFSIEMLAGRPVLRTAGPAGARTLDLASGSPSAGIGAAGALAVARAYVAGHGLAGRPRLLGRVDADQWTVEQARSGPFFRLDLGDRDRTELYVRVRTGEAAQAATRAERRWAWLGPIPHWLYPYALRRHPAAWSALVVWTSLVGVFLTLTGLYVGMGRFRRGADGRWSPYRGWRYWHHLAGLAFGALLFTWTASGWLTMTPWGLLDSDPGAAVQEAVAGEVTAAEIQSFLAHAGGPWPTGAVALQSAALGGRLFVMATGPDGRQARYDALGRPSPLTPGEVSAALARAGPVRGMELATREDDYHHSGYDGPAQLPAYRARLPGSVTVYLDPASGRVLQAVDDTARQSRWLRTGLHDLDFAWLGPARVRDAVMLMLLAGAGAVSLTGAWLALKRATRDLRGLGRGVARRADK